MNQFLYGIRYGGSKFLLASYFNPVGYPALKAGTVKNFGQIFLRCERVTQPETNSSPPENRPSQKEINLPSINFQGQPVSFRECNHIRMGFANQLDYINIWGSHVSSMLHFFAGLGRAWFAHFSFWNWETNGCFVSLVLVFLYVQSEVDW